MQLILTALKHHRTRLRVERKLV